jgi:hypothetical protein
MSTVHCQRAPPFELGSRLGQISLSNQARGHGFLRQECAVVDPQLLSTSKCFEMRSPNPKMADDEGHSSVETPALGVTGLRALKLLRLGLSLLY